MIFLKVVAAGVNASWGSWRRFTAHPKGKLKKFFGWDILWGKQCVMHFFSTCGLNTVLFWKRHGFVQCLAAACGLRFPSVAWMIPHLIAFCYISLQILNVSTLRCQFAHSCAVCFITFMFQVFCVCVCVFRLSLLITAEACFRFIIIKEVENLVETYLFLPQYPF